MKKSLQSVAAFALLIFMAGSLSAQWRLAASNVIVPISRPYNGGGVITSHNGILWAGYKDVWMSSDTGRSWTKRTPFNGFNNSCIKDISFFDDNTGLATTQNGEIYITSDQGFSWVQHIPNSPFHFRPSIESARFLGTPNNIVACSYAGDRCVSTDGGINWIVTLSDSIASQVIAGSGGTAYIAGGFDGGSAVGVRLHETNDFGITWFDRNDVVDWDSYSFARDQCDTSVFYAVSDDQEARIDKFSHIFSTTSSGDSWRLCNAEPLPSFCGSVSTSANAVFVQSYSGIRRSTDQGNTWKNIGGPPNVVDTRFITALDNNVIVAVDSFGSVWVTTNSGGDSLILIDGSKLSILTADQKTDTIGGTVAVPISVNGLSNQQDINMVVHYDLKLSYKGTYSPANVKLDVAGQSWSGRAKIHIPGANSSGILAQAYFDVFSDSSDKPAVTFDSLTILSAIIPCNNILLYSASSVITPVTGCSADILTHFMRDSTAPQLSINPNPANGEIFITSSENLGEVSISIFDMLGVQKGESTITLGKHIPAKILLSQPNGMYVLAVHSSSRIFYLHLIVNR